MVSRSGIVLERLAERQMLHLCLDRKPGRVGRQERERCVLILPVLGKVEVHAADQVPGGMATFKEFLCGEPGLGQLGVEGRINATPQIGQYGRGQVFGAGHWRSCRGHSLQRAVGRCGHSGLHPALAEIGQSAKRRHIAATEFPPVRKHRWQNRADLVGAQRQQSVPRAPCEGRAELRAEGGLQSHSIAGEPQSQYPVRRENRRQNHAQPTAAAAPSAETFWWIFVGSCRRVPACCVRLPRYGHAPQFRGLIIE